MPFDPPPPPPIFFCFFPFFLGGGGGGGLVEELLPKWRVGVGMALGGNVGSAG